MAKTEKTIAKEMITEHFSKKEFSCPCGCGFNDVNPILVERLEMIRNALREPIRIMSGCRCQKHNERVRGKPNSAHLRGNAADINCPDSGFRYRFLKQAFKIFNRIEVPNGPWIHVDVDATLPQDVCFTR